MKRLKRLFATVGAKNTVALLALALMIACTGYTIVNRFVNIVIGTLPPKEVTITVVESEHPGTEVWILSETTRDMNLFDECLYGEKTGVWEYRDAVEWQYTANTLVSYGDNIGSSITFYSPVSPDAGVLFWVHPGCGAVSISTDGGEPVYYDLFSDTGGTKTIYPFENSLFPVFLRLVLYGLQTVLFFVIILLIVNSLTSGKRKVSKLLTYPSCKKVFFILWGCLYLFAVMQYLIGIPNYLTYGDQPYYWNFALIRDGRWDVGLIAAEIYTPRGYLTSLLPNISKIIGTYFDIDPVYIYLIFPSAAIAWLSADIVPSLYEQLTNKKSTYFQVIVFTAVYLFFWNGYLTAALSDMYGAVAFLGGTVYALKAYHLPKKTTSFFLCGLCWAVACSFRIAYQYIILLLIFYAVLVKLIALYRLKKSGMMPQNHGATARRIMSGVFCAILAFVLVSLPQLQINLERGHIGLLPYDYDEAWTSMDGTEPASVMEWSANVTIADTYMGWPYGVASDDQMLTMKPQMYDQKEMLSIPQLLSVYARSPIETLVYIAKKLVLAFDVKTSVNYPNVLNWRGSTGLVFSLLNYTVLGSALYFVFAGKQLTKRERILCGLFFAGMVLPQMFLHVEWRFFMATYILLYMFFAYHFVGEVLANRQKCSELLTSNFLVYLDAAIIVAYTISLTIYA